MIFASIWSLISLAVLEIVPRFAPRGKDNRTAGAALMCLEREMLTRPRSIPPVQCSGIRVHQRHLLVCRIHRYCRLPEQAALLPKCRVRRSPGRCGHFSLPVRHLGCLHLLHGKGCVQGGPPQACSRPRRPVDEGDRGLIRIRHCTDEPRLLFGTHDAVSPYRSSLYLVRKENISRLGPSTTRISVLWQEPGQEAI